MGIVAAMVNVPHELSANAFTTTRPSPAKATTSIIRTAIDAIKPLVLLISARAISTSDFPSWRIEASRMIKSCIAPAIMAPARIHNTPGAYPN